MAVVVGGLPSDARAPMPSLGRMMVFVDGENLVNRFEDMKAKGATPASSLDYERGVYVWHRSTVKVDLNIVTRAIYYTYAQGGDEKLRAIEERIKSLEFRQYGVPNEPSTGKLINTLFPKVFKKAKNARSGKGVDIQMTLDILTRSCTHKEDSQMVADVIQASKLWELDHGRTLRSDGF